MVWGKRSIGLLLCLLVGMPHVYTFSNTKARVGAIMVGALAGASVGGLKRHASPESNWPYAWGAAAGLIGWGVADAYLASFTPMATLMVIERKVKKITEHPLLQQDIADDSALSIVVEMSYGDVKDPAAMLTGELKSMSTSLNECAQELRGLSANISVKRDYVSLKLISANIITLEQRIERLLPLLAKMKSQS